MEVKHAKNKNPHKLLDNVSGVLYAGQVRLVGYKRRHERISSVRRAALFSVLLPCLVLSLQMIALMGPSGSGKTTLL